MPAGQRAIALATLLGTLCVGCPSRFDPRAQPNLASPNAAAEKAFRAARSRFEAGQHEAARADFERFARDYPDDPLRPFAQVFDGRAAYEKGDYRGARAILEPVAKGPPADPATEQARFYLGLSRARLFECEAAGQLLAPFQERMAAGDDLMELHVALAACAEHAHDAAAALGHWSSYWELGREAEKAFAVGKAQALAEGLAGERALALYGTAAPRSLARAVLGPKAALAARAQADAGRSEEIQRDSERLRERFGLGGRREEASTGTMRLDPRVVGCLLPLSGPYKQQGQRALRGAAMAIEALARGAHTPLVLAVRDTGGDRARTARALDELVTEEGAIAVVGPLDKGDAEAAGARALALGVPLVELTVAPGGPSGPYVFRAMHDPTARVRALVGRARAQGAQAAAVLYPDNAYGRRMRELFGEEAQRAGISVVGAAAYDGAATAFGGSIRELKARRFDTLFVPDLASRLELIGPALAAADLWPAVPGSPRPRVGRNVLLLSTAEDLSTRLLHESRYLQGALLAPGYFPEEDSFVQQYRAENNEDPKLFEAFAYDAVHVVRAALEAGARDRAQLAAQIGAHGGVSGVTGTVRFAPTGERADAAAVYTVAGDAIHRAP
jgi:ABC-type branched-subunit amino acid transport system substrate-binding protein